MINEVLEGAKISFMDRKESDLERKVRKLEQDMMHLDSILNKEKQVRNKSMEFQKSADSNETMPNNIRLSQDYSTQMAQGDGPDPWMVMPISIHRYSTSSQFQPAFFFTWDCTPYDFHNNSAQRSIYTLLGQWQPGGHSMSADHFKKQLSALLAANSSSASNTDPPFNYQKDIGDIQNRTEKNVLYIAKPEAYNKKPNVDTKNSDFDANKSEPDPINSDLETRELLSNLEKKLKEVEIKCRDDYVKVLNPFTTNKTKTQNPIADSYGKNDDQNDKNAVIIDEIIFEMFKDSQEEFGAKPIELAKEVDDLQGFIQSYKEAGDTIFQKLNS